jgi:peptidoglycan DL-endopeptidase CwlO
MTRDQRLELGARGPAVEHLQDQLNELGEHLDVDGVYGPWTRIAVKRLQIVSGLEVTGIVDAATWDALDDMTRRAPAEIALLESQG